MMRHLACTATETTGPAPRSTAGPRRCAGVLADHSVAARGQSPPGGVAQLRIHDTLVKVARGREPRRWDEPAGGKERKSDE